MERLEEHLRGRTSDYRKRPVIGVDDGNGWRISYLISKAGRTHLPSERPTQAAAYDRARVGGPRGNLGAVPPAGETAITPIDLDDGVPAAAPAIWMEIRRWDNDEGLGTRLYAFRTQENGAVRPAFSRVLKVRTGDVVLHWWRKQLLGSSVVAGSPAEDEDGVRVPLREFIRFVVPITLEMLQAHPDEVLAVYSSTRSDPRWSQFPFQVNTVGAVTIHGAPTTYFVPVPPELIEAIPTLTTQLSVALQTQKEVAEAEPADTNVAHESDPLRRRAIELYAEDVAIAELTRDGYSRISRVGKPYDIKAHRGSEELHIEVKGSSGDAESVILTRNEVSHASSKATTLIVVDMVEVAVTNDGYECSRGRLRRWDNWVPDAADLSPIQYVYKLPPP